MYMYIQNCHNMFIVYDTYMYIMCTLALGET